MKITDREKYLFWLILYTPMWRYITVNMPGYTNGDERAERHILICKLICHFILNDGGISTIGEINSEWPQGWKEVHQWTVDNITDNMDITIGFIVNRPMTYTERKMCIKKMFDKIIDNIDTIEQIVLSAPKKSVYLNNGLA